MKKIEMIMHTTALQQQHVTPDSPCSSPSLVSLPSFFFVRADVLQAQRGVRPLPTRRTCMNAAHTAATFAQCRVSIDFGFNVCLALASTQKGVCEFRQ